MAPEPPEYSLIQTGRPISSYAANWFCGAIVVAAMVSFVLGFILGRN